MRQSCWASLGRNDQCSHSLEVIRNGTGTWQAITTDAFVRFLNADYYGQTFYPPEMGHFRYFGVQFRQDYDERSRLYASRIVHNLD